MPKADSETALLVADSGAALTQATATAKPLAMPVPHATTTGDVIEDRRTEDEINRRIFTQDEGEYVDFEEVE